MSLAAPAGARFKVATDVSSQSPYFALPPFIAVSTDTQSAKSSEIAQMLLALLASRSVEQQMVEGYRELANETLAEVNLSFHAQSEVALRND